MKYLKTYWGKCFNIEGRCSRRTYWMTWLVNLCIVGSFVILGIILHIGGSSASCDPVMKAGTALTMMGMAYGVICMIPGVCMDVRRLHDRNLTGWLLILILFPAANIFILVMFLLGPRDAGNRWGLISD